MGLLRRSRVESMTEQSASLELYRETQTVKVLKRDVEPLEGTRMSLFNSIIPAWWNDNGLSVSSMFPPGDGALAQRVWVCNRCIQLNAQQIASMPLRFESPNVAADGQPAWLSSPDPERFPNGISDAIFAIIRNLYGWGYAILYVTAFYADGYPRNWTVLHSRQVSVTIGLAGGKVYKLGDTTLDPARVVQIDRDPGHECHGTSALQAYAQQAWGLLAASNQQMAVSQGAMPKVYLKPQRKVDSTQAANLQQQWMTAAGNRNGAPPVVPPDLDVNELSFQLADLALLDTQKWNAEVLATAYGVPSVILNMALQGGLTYQNPAALGEMWWRFELRPTAKRMVDALTAQMLPSGQFVWVDASDTFAPLSGATSPVASDEDDPQAANDDVTPVSATAQASPGPRLAAIGGRA